MDSVLLTADLDLSQGVQTGIGPRRPLLHFIIQLLSSDWNAKPYQTSWINPKFQRMCLL